MSVGISVGSVSVMVVPDAAGFVPKLDAQLTDIPSVGVTVTLDDMEAMAKLDELRTSLDEIGHKSVSASVRVDTGGAAADLAKLRTEMDAATSGDGSAGGGVFASIGTAAQSASSAISPMVAAILTLGTALVPIGAAAVAGLGAIATVAATGTAALGVLYLGLSDVLKAVEAVGKARQSSAADAAAQAQAEVSAANQVRSARAQLVNAEQAAGDAVRKQAQDQITAQESLAAASKQVTQARVTGAQQILSAEQGLASAETSLTNAVYTETQAQQALVLARQAAQRQLESYQQQVADGALQQRQDALNVEAAEQTLRATLSNPSSSYLQRDQAQLSYDQAVQAQKDQAQNYQNLLQDAAAAARAGVDGSMQVVAAQHNVVTAHQGVETAQRNVANAAAAVKKAQVDAAAAITAAIQHQGDVERQVANQQITDSEAVASAQRAVVGAQAAVTTALDAQRHAAITLSSSHQAANAALAALTPTGRSLVTFITGTLMPAFTGLKGAAENGLIPGLQSGLASLLPVLPGVTKFVGDFAGVMGNLAAQAGKALTGPFWTQFFAWVASTAGPTLQTMADTIGSFVQGLAGMVQALSPLTNMIGQAFQGMADGFARFATNTTPGSPLEQFISFAQKALPAVGSTLEEVGKAFGHIVVAAAPIGMVVLSVLKEVAKVIGAIPTPILTAIIGALAVLAPIILAVAAATAIWAAAGTALEIVLAVIGSPIVLLIAAIAAIGFAIYELVTHWRQVWGWIKDIVTDAWHFITGAFSAAWNWVSGFVSQHWDLIVGLLTGPLGLVVAEIVKHWSDITGAFSAAWNWVSGVFAALWSGITDIVTSPISLAVNQVSGFVDGIVNFFEQLPGRIITALGNVGEDIWKTITKHIPGGGLIGDAFNFVAGHATGGVIPGYAPGVDSVPAMLSPGEAVLRPEVARWLGVSTIDGWNQAAMAGTLAAWHGPGTAMHPPAAPAAPSGPSGRRGGVRDVTINAVTNANPYQIGQELMWLSKTMD